jgi:multidrug efflux system outer membrane protein
VERAQANYDSSAADIHDLERQIAQQENAISILIGAFPQEIVRGRPLTDQITPETPVGSTTALLQRRPDIQQSEQNMMAANAEIGVAMADYFPKIGLSSFLGAEGLAVADTVQTFGVWNLALSAAGPIYSGGRLEAAYRQRQAFWDETIAQYKQKVLAAFQETSDALIARKTLAARRTALASQVVALERSAGLALDRYENGRASYFEVLEAQQLLFPAQDELARNQRDQLIAVVNLYKALGGGWNAGEPAATPEAKPLQAQVEVEVETGE